MNALITLAYGAPLMAAGLCGMLRLAWWFDTPSVSAMMRRQAHVWHNNVVDHEIAQGMRSYDMHGRIVYVYDEITDINPVTFM